MEFNKRLDKLRETAKAKNITASELLCYSYKKDHQHQKNSKPFFEGFAMEMLFRCNEIRASEMTYNPGTLAHDAWILGKHEARNYFNYHLLKLRDFRAWGYQIEPDEETQRVKNLKNRSPTLLGLNQKKLITLPK